MNLQLIKTFGKKVRYSITHIILVMKNPVVKTNIMDDVTVEMKPC